MLKEFLFKLKSTQYIHIIADNEEEAYDKIDEDYLRDNEEIVSLELLEIYDGTEDKELL